MKPEDLLEFNNKALDKLIAGTGFSGLGDLLAQKVSRPVLITNLSNKVMGSSIPSIPEGDILAVEGIELEFSRCLLRLNEKTIRTGFVPIQGIKKLGYIFVLDFQEDKDEDILLYARELVRFCALEFSRIKAIRYTIDEYRSAFIYDLLYGNMDDPADLIERGKLWGWNLKKPHAVVVFLLTDYERFSADEECISLITNATQSITIQLLELPIILAKQDQVICVLPVEKPSRREEKAFLKMFVDKVNREIRQRLTARTVRAGIGRVYASAGELFRSYQEAKVALELGYMTDSNAGTPFFTELGLERLLYNHDQQELTEFYNEALGSLEKLDQAVKDELLGTLEKYLLNQCNLKATAEMLFLHPNTLRYRLKKIEEILELDLEDFDSKLNLITALKIKYLKKG